jgi:hypothetical protein
LRTEIDLSTCFADSGKAFDNSYLVAGFGERQKVSERRASNASATYEYFEDHFSLLSVSLFEMIADSDKRRCIHAIKQKDMLSNIKKNGLICA